MKNVRLRALERLERAVRQGEKALSDLGAMPPLADTAEIQARFERLRAEVEKLAEQRLRLVNAISAALGNHGRITHMTRAELGQLVMRLVNG